MQKLLIINNVWSPYVQARYSAIAEFSPFAVTVFYQVKKDPNRQWTQDQEGLYTACYLDSFTFSLSKNTALSLIVNYNIYGQLKSLNPDYIIMCGWDTLATLQVLLYAKLNHKKIILWAGSTLNEPSLVRTITNPYVKWLIRRFDGFISYGSASASYLRYLGAKKQIHHYYNSVDINAFARGADLSDYEKLALKTAIGLPANADILISCGRLVPIKCVDLLIDAFAVAQASLPQLALLVVGQGPEENALRLKAKNLSNIHFLGHQDVGQLAKLYSISDVLVLNSRSETWGLVVNEAMACNCAIIVSDRCGCAPDLIKDNGFIIASSNQAILASAIQNIFADKNALTRMQKKSGERIKQFSDEHIVKRIFNNLFN